MSNYDDKETLFKMNELYSLGANDGKRNSGIERKKGQFDVIGWLIRQNEYARYAERNKLLMTVKAGEIYEVDFGVNVNAEFSYRHYALVLADSSESNPLALVCPLKSNTKGPHPYSDLNLGYIDALDSDHESLAVINQIRTIDKLRIFKHPIINKSNGPKYHFKDYYPYESSYDDYHYRNTYRLEKEKFDMVQTAIQNYLQYGQISPNKEN